MVVPCLWKASGLGLSILLSLFIITAGADNTIRCLGGWNGDSSQIIPESWINDGYCDCPFDGRDEPGTNACSGSSQWPGVTTATSSSPPKVFVCPQQPNLILPLSRVHDGICDCCDGADEENERMCQNNCDILFKAERERLAKLHNDFLIGSRKRDIDLDKFTKLRRDKLEEVQSLEADLQASLAEIDRISNTQILGLKRDYVLSRMFTMKDIVDSTMAQELVGVLSNNELEALIVHLCQLAGEIAEHEEWSEAYEDTCVSLRVAAMDLGLSWTAQEDFGNFKDTMKGNVNMTGPMIQLIFENAMDRETRGRHGLRWNPSPKTKKTKNRRLDEVFDDDDYMPILDDDHFERHNDEWDEEEDSFEKGRDVEEEDDPISAQKSIGKDEFLSNLKESPFSKHRAKFLEESKIVLETLSAALEKGSDSDHGTKDLQTDTEVTLLGDKDPSVYSTLRDDLKRKESVIRKGFQWGASAKLLFAFSSLRDSKDNLRRLAIGTIFYGQVSALEVWTVLMSILPEFQSMSTSMENDTCASPWASQCPPKQSTRELSEDSNNNETIRIQYPPSFLVDEAKTFCEKEAAKFGESMDSCSERKSIDFLLSQSQETLGFSAPTPRHEQNDPFRSMFQPIESLPIDADGLREWEKAKTAKEDEKRDLTKSIDGIWKDIGGKDGTKFGRDGELHSISDQCFDIVAGKYTYEVCFFGKAQQKEGSNKSGTNLGQFKGIEYDVQSDLNTRRIAKWENGAKCWNGPHRSATVYMTCGSENKLISADEPDTCRYVFEMESYLACDEAYRVEMGL